MYTSNAPTPAGSIPAASTPAASIPRDLGVVVAFSRLEDRFVPTTTPRSAGVWDARGRSSATVAAGRGGTGRPSNSRARCAIAAGSVHLTGRSSHPPPLHPSAPPAAAPTPTILELWLPLRGLSPVPCQPQLQDRGGRLERSAEEGADGEVRQRGENARTGE